MPQKCFSRGVSIIILGGFLGSGKTTAILRLASRYSDGGKRVAVIANDLSEGLVDFEMYRAHGLAVEELAGGCFACKFDDLVAAAGKLQDGYEPDVIVAEPAGSCTDIVSRVILPLKEVYGERFRVSPYVTLVDPHRALKALRPSGPKGFSAKVTFLYMMQQNEADIVAVNKIDLLSTEERREIIDLVSCNFPKAQVISISARTGEGFGVLADTLGEKANSGANPIADGEIDRCLSLEGDASLAWVNIEASVKADASFSPKGFLLRLLEGMRSRFQNSGNGIGHVKCAIRSREGSTIANLVSEDRKPEISFSDQEGVCGGRVLLNARVEATPEALLSVIQDELNHSSTEMRVVLEIESIKQLSADPTNSSCRI